MKMKEPFIVHCAKCSHEWSPCFLPVPVKVLVVVGKRPCPACGHKHVLCGPLPRPTADGDARAWISNGDTGLSSETIWRVLTGWVGTAQWYPSVPLDPSDFGRCYRLLYVMPSWRARLSEVSQTYPEWERLVDVWDELTALYKEELPKKTAPKLYARIQEFTTHVQADRR